MQHECAFKLPPHDMKQVQRFVTKLERYKAGADSVATCGERHVQLPFQEADYEYLVEEAQARILLLTSLLSAFAKHQPAPK